MKYSRSRRMQYARLILIAQDRIALKYGKRYSAEIKRAGQEYASAFVSGKTKFTDITKRHNDKLADIGKALALETAARFAKAPWLGVKAALPVFDTEMEDRVYDIISRTAAQRAVNISQATEDQIRNIMASGLADGIGIARIAGNMTNRTEGLLSRHRSATIARTEVHSAANQSQFEMAEEVGVSLKREWISTNDDRVRDTHSDVDGQVRGTDEPFDVGGEELMYPGDPSGSPENVINCRCVVGYVEDK